MWQWMPAIRLGDQVYVNVQQTAGALWGHNIETHDKTAGPKKVIYEHLIIIYVWVPRNVHGVYFSYAHVFSKPTWFEMPVMTDVYSYTHTMHLVVMCYVLVPIIVIVLVKIVLVQSGQIYNNYSQL